ncbi:uncharacterized protein G2W53_002804 [Senna tora]|uniref:Uncharacterized protein n=1 Tax=Senna tora TaxID=362788 RepID=A0A835CF49_9FABA|nr:uncharacterized protein G2W53_002804 [Senna tora]
MQLRLLSHEVRSDYGVVSVSEKLFHGVEGEGASDFRTTQRNELLNRIVGEISHADFC